MRCRCRKKLIRWGTTSAGIPRWRCRVCGQTTIRQSAGFRSRLLKKFLLDGKTAELLSEEYRCHPNTVRNRLNRIFNRLPSLPIPADSGAAPCWLVTDATHFKRWGCLFVTKTTSQSQPIAVSFHDRECFQSALSHLMPLSSLAVSGYTSDGKKGLVMAYQQLFPDACFQRCLVHIRMRVQTLLTSRPKLPAGQDLLGIAQQLTKIKTTTEAHCWWELFTAWQQRWQPVLNERTYRENIPILPLRSRRRRWWYTHRNLRYSWKHILHAADHLFVFLEHPQAVSHTNHLEGLFGQRKPSLYRHRGLSRRRVANALLWTFYLLRKR